MDKLRIVSFAAQETTGFVDLAVTPQALAHMSLEYNGKFLKPLDFLTRDDMYNTKMWVVETVMAMDLEWSRKGVMPLFIKSIGLELCVLLELIKITDIVLTKIWETGHYSEILIDNYKIFKDMIEYEDAKSAYADLLSDDDWCKHRSIKVHRGVPKKISKEAINLYPNKKPLWKRYASSLLNMIRYSKSTHTGVLSTLMIKIGMKMSDIPKMIVVPNKDTAEMLKYEGSVNLNNYLAILPLNRKKTKEIERVLIDSLENWFNNDIADAMKRIAPYKHIIKKRVQNFIKKRRDLLNAYVKIDEIEDGKSLRILLPSSGGCGTDAWCSMAIEEKGGTTASGQHGGGYGNLNLPYILFSDARFKYFFSYGRPEISPAFEFTKRNGNAKWVEAGSPVLYSIKKRCGQPPSEIRKILYIMNLCVPFYSANFPWEFVLEQFKVLELLNKYSSKYIIHVKEEQTGTVKHELYPGLSFIKESPRDVLHEYDMLIVESGISTAVLEAAVTNRYVVVYTGAGWEDVSPESLDALSKRTECFHSWKDFLAGLKNILDNPSANLDSNKLSSPDFIKTYCNPVSSQQYIDTIKKTFILS